MLAADGVFGTDHVGAAEVDDDLGDAVVVRQRATADVDVMSAGLVEFQLDVVTGVS